jgi:F0F1-type ATP synthase membrane subunit c/vacuolar-type H+-ATPase subunit K
MYKLVISLLLFFFLSTSQFAFAQSTNSSQQGDAAATLGVAHMVPVKDKNIKDGSILTSTAKGAVLSKLPYDSLVLGVVSRDAGIILSSTDDKDSVPVIADGIVYVLVSTQQGQIKKQDLITTSTTPGIGVKATNSGYVVGYALEDYSSNDPKKIGKIAVNLSLHYFNSRPTLAGALTDVLKIALLPTDNGPAPIFKYVVAALVVLGSFALGFISFARTAAKGVEALGRNPSASAMIHLGIIFNVSIVIAIILAGLVVAFLILRL